MKVTANGKPVDLPDEATIADLLDELGLGNRGVIVEKNGEPVPRAVLLGTVLADGDRLELVRAVAGG